LFAALSRAVPAFHAPGCGPRFAPITGDPAGSGRIALAARSVLRVRAPADALPAVLPLVGLTLTVGDGTVRLGPPTVVPLVPAATVRVRVVTIKNARDPDRFLTAVRAGLAALGVAGEPSLPAFVGGPRIGEPRRRVVRVKGAVIAGYALVVAGLTAEHSIRLQEAGLGGRTRIGCGFFLPFDPEGAK
jgi:CRISPR-associated protein Cas6